MLQVQVLRDSRESVLSGLAKRGIKNAATLVDAVIRQDDLRKETQRKLDDLKSQSNLAAKNIGELMKSGKQEEAAALRNAVASGKEEIKNLESILSEASESLTRALYAIPNVPHEKVPAGTSSKENIVVHEHGTIPTLHTGALPH